MPHRSVGDACQIGLCCTKYTPLAEFSSILQRVVNPGGRVDELCGEKSSPAAERASKTFLKWSKSNVENGLGRDAQALKKSRGRA